MLTKRMAMRRMNEMWMKLALNLVFCVLLFHTCQGQDVSTSIQYTHSTPGVLVSFQDLSEDTTDSEITATISNTAPSAIINQSSHFPGTVSTMDAKTMSPDLQTDEAITTKQPLEHPATFLVTTLEDELQSTKGIKTTIDAEAENLNQHQITLGGAKGPSMQSEQKDVLVSIVISGLILAAALIGVYVWRNHCPKKGNVMKLANESCMVEEDNQGNTLVSVAPLNPPESQEKPSQNGESLEAVKTQNPPVATNGHSTAKADTEL